MSQILSRGPVGGTMFVMQIRNATVTEDLRARTIAALGRCDACGRGGVPHRKAAADAGVPHATFHRFINGSPVQSETLDRIAAWLERLGDNSRKGGRPRKERT